MQIIIKNIVPHPIKETFSSKTEIWNKELSFSLKKKYLIQSVSGKGKTSLLSTLYGIRKDYSGNVFFDEENIKNFTAKKWSEIRQTKISYIFQGLELFSKLSVVENILIKNQQTNHKSENEIITLAKKLNIFDLLNKKTNKISYGQQQRIAFIRALCQPFNYLFLDEPFSHLDSENVKIIFEIIEEELSQRNATMILTSLNNNYNFNFDKVLNL